MVPHRFRVTILNLVVLMHHVVHSDDADNDADHTVGELVADINKYNGYISTAILQSALYCCNMENEKGKFWHPLGQSFDQMIYEMFPPDMRFDKYYNVIHEVKRGQEKRPEDGRPVGQNT